MRRKPAEANPCRGREALLHLQNANPDSHFGLRAVLGQTDGEGGGCSPGWRPPPTSMGRSLRSRGAEGHSGGTPTASPKGRTCRMGSTLQHGDGGHPLGSNGQIRHSKGQIRQISRFLTYRAFFSMNWRRGSTSSPMRREKMESASAVLSMVTCIRVREVGSMVVDQS